MIARPALAAAYLVFFPLDKLVSHWVGFSLIARSDQLTTIGVIPDHRGGQLIWPMLQLTTLRDTPTRSTWSLLRSRREMLGICSEFGRCFDKNRTALACLLLEPAGTV